MKKLYIGVLALSLLGGVHQANAQISIGAQGTFINLFGGTGIKSVGVGIRGGYAYADDMIGYGGFNYYLPNKQEYTTSATAMSSTTTPQYVDVDIEYKMPMIHIYVGANKYFVGDSEDDMGVYGLVEAGLLMAPVTTTVGTYNSSLYYVSEEDGAKETYSNLTIGLGAGGEKDLGFGYLFGEVKLNLPANRANGQVVEIEIPASASLHIGVRVPF